MWGRKKSSSASSSSRHSSSFLSHVSLLSWLSKFKHMRVNTEPSGGKVKQQKGKANSVCVSSSQYACGIGGGCVSLSGDDDGIWRLPFGEEVHEGKRTKDILETQLSNLDDDLVVPVSISCSNGGFNERSHGREEGTLKFKEIGTEKESKFPKGTKISLQIDDYDREKELETLRKTFEKKAQKALHEKLLKLEKVSDKAESASTKSLEKDVIIQLESPRTICTPRTQSLVPSLASKKNPRLGSIKTESRSSEKKLGIESERQHLKKNEMMKTSKPKHRSKVRVCSPRMGSKTETCKIKHLEDFKKAKLKRKKAKERMMMEKTELSDSFAVVRCSMNPEKDFRDSMVEMITEMKIHQPEEYEELLTCYLTLNSDDYHNLIVKVFREVWFDMNKDVLGISLRKQYG
ncbi:hypothetical protein QN277_020392 [Acacia crassicarpa]|uniref:Transcription repressor n=1 Tax=Acacia crassicarpa TaxID=499986 RepID=A0AAE1MS29_9FABA|nr:hypothetical protein QN277_020392 [Acacia crassicarpa]